MECPLTSKKTNFGWILIKDKKETLRLPFNTHIDEKCEGVKFNARNHSNSKFNYSKYFKKPYSCDRDEFGCLMNLKVGINRKKY